MEVQDQRHPCSMLEKLNEQRLQGLFCDITVVVEDTKFRAHKNILAASSTYFKVALTKKSMCLSDPVLELPDVQAEVFSHIVNFIYNSRVTVPDSDIAKEMVAVGRQLGMCWLECLDDGAHVQRTQTSLSEKSSSACGTRVVSNNQGSEEYRLSGTPSSQIEQEPHAPLLPSVLKTILPSESSLASSSPVKCATRSIRKTIGLDSSSNTPLLKNSSLQQNPAENNPPVSLSGSPQVQGHGTLSPGSNVKSKFFQATQQKDNRSPCSSVDTEADTEETARILYTLGTAQNIPGCLSDTEQETLMNDNCEWDSVDCSASENNEPECPSTTPGTLDVPSAFPQTLFTCAICTRSFSSSTALSLHVKLHRSRKGFFCSHCNKSFIHIKRLQTHELMCKQTGCLDGKENEGGLDALDVREMPHSSELQHLQETKHLTAKKGHAGLLFRHRNFQRLEVNAEQDHFVKVVDGHIIYFCSICERSYMTLSSLKRHSNVHSWRRRYPCHYCEKVFALAEYRTKHEVWHTGERRYQCIFCWETFVTYYNLKTHQKAFHGINPGLICSEKTPNGGYKPKLNAVKLYRLLPMRSEKRPYKTYSQSNSGTQLMPSHSLPVAMGSSGTLDTNVHPTILTRKDVNSPTMQGSASSLNLKEPEARLLKSNFTPSSQNRGQMSKRSHEPLKLDFSAYDLETEKHFENAIRLPLEEHFSHIEATELVAQEGSSDGVAPSVIAYGHPSSSVIVRSPSVSSTMTQCTQGPSVITFNSKSFPRNQASTPITAEAARPLKKSLLKDSMLAKVPQASTDQSSEDSDSEEETDSDHKTARIKGKIMTYTAKPAYVGDATGSRNVPLCQITVRIGEEAIVKRRISETDLMRDKSPTSKLKRFDYGSERSRGQKHGHGGGRKTSSLRNSRACNDADSDHDGEDHLWRPYYSYKPKRKGCTVQKVKKSRWHRKLHYKRALKKMKRAEREKEVFDPTTLEDSPALAESEIDTPELENTEREPSPEPQIKKVHTSSRKAEWKYECTICGKRFSALKKFQKHERVHSHITTFPCVICRNVFPTQQMAAQHKETHSSEAGDEPVSSEQVIQSNTGQAPSFNVRAVRVGRKPSLKHRCSCCTKVCKTLAALNRHIKCHETEQPSAFEEDCKEANQRGDESHADELAQTSLPTVIAFSKSNDRRSKTPLALESMLLESPVKNIEDLQKSPTPLTVKKEIPQEVQVCPEAGEATLLRETESEQCLPCSSSVLGPIQSAGSPLIAVLPSQMHVALERPGLSTPLSLKLHSQCSEDRSVQETVEDRNCTEMPKVVCEKFKMHTCSKDTILKATHLQRPHLNHQHENIQPQAAMNPEALPLSEVLLPPLDGPKVVSSPCQITHQFNEEAYGQENKFLPELHGNRDQQRVPEAYLGTPNHSACRQSAKDISLQDPLISHTGMRLGPSLVQKPLPSQMADAFQGSFRHDMCLEPGYPVQEYPLPLLTQGSWRTEKAMEEKTLLTCPGQLPFNSMSKTSEAAAKVAFYPDPYSLMYGHQLLAYPYGFTNLAALPVALNMVIPGDKGQPLPFLPSMFGYSVNPCRSEVQEAPVLLNRGQNNVKGTAASQERPKKGHIL